MHETRPVCISSELSRCRKANLNERLGARRKMVLAMDSAPDLLHPDATKTSPLSGPRRKTFDDEVLLSRTPLGGPRQLITMIANESLQPR